MPHPAAKITFLANAGEPDVGLATSLLVPLILARVKARTEAAPCPHPLTSLAEDSAASPSATSSAGAK